MPSFAYVAAGNSTNKKDAEKNAARDFASFLIRTGKVQANDVPADVLDSVGGAPTTIQPLMGNNGNQSTPTVFKVHNKSCIIFCGQN